VAKIETSQTYEKGRPKLGGLSDPRLGTMDRALKCTTDGNGVLDCHGYFGHIELAKPMFHVHFLKTVVKVLRCVSYHNSKLMILPVSGWARGCGVRAGWLWRRGAGAAVEGRQRVLNTRMQGSSSNTLHTHQILAACSPACLPACPAHRRIPSTRPA
jgi:hypothetical protein